MLKRKKMTMDGNIAAAHVAYAYSEVAAIYPITPSSTMAEITDEWAAGGRKNIFGQELQVSEMQSEAGAAGAVHGSLIAGALTTTFTASQGLLLMIPNLYKIAGELLPGVFHVAARTVASHALSIFGDHSDIYACRQTGVAILASSSVQEVMDLTPIAHLAALKGNIPFINFFDGFRTSHEMQKIDVWDYETLKEMMDMEALQNFRNNALTPDSPKQMGQAQNPDIFFQVREACNKYYEQLPEIVEEYMDKINKKINTNYKLFKYYGDESPKHIIIAMGSVCQTIEETVDYLNAKGEKTGVINVHLYRPFSAKHLINEIPDSVEKITVLDRTKEPGSIGEPLFLDVVTALRDTKFHNIPIFSGRYGLSSKDTTPDQINAVYKNTEKKRFTIGIVDDVTHLSLDVQEKINSAPKNNISCRFWGLGGDGTVGANKNSIKIIGKNTDMFVQAYFEYDSKKSRGLTISNLRFGNQPIKSSYLVQRADFVACHNSSYIRKYNMVQQLKDGGTFLLNCSWNKDELENEIPGQAKRYMYEHNIQFYTIDGIGIGKEIGLNGKINTILQSAFFALTNIISQEDAKKMMKEAAKASYEKKGNKIVEMNYEAIDKGADYLVKVNIPESWKDAEDEPLDMQILPDREAVVKYVKNIQHTIGRNEGDSLPVSAFEEYVDGSTPSGTAAHERRNVAVDVPVWISENCIQCNRCSYVCPHAVIRPFALDGKDKDNAPEGLETIKLMGVDGHEFAIGISYVDCTGCGSCVGICPGKKGEKALEMRPANEHVEKQKYFDYCKDLKPKKEVLDKFKETTVKGSQFIKPLLEYHGACAGCGETTYVKLLTQLYGDRMYIANATGCSSIWGNSSPTTPYTVNHCGKGPAWANSLFEDAAEFGYGMLMAQKTEKIREKNKNNLPEKSQWVIGGDGWAYDIGFGGLDHILASGENINVLVLDTEVYSNTGGQASKATPVGAVAKFTATGRNLKKKDLAGIAMTYGYVYVAQIAMGADFNQTIKALKEAGDYEGPSLIIAYSPCISHGIKAGMGSSQHEESKAVDAGYWNLFRYNPLLKEQGKNPFILDSKEPTLDYDEFLSGEIRYLTLKNSDPQKAEKLFEIAKQNAKERYKHLQKLSSLYSQEEEE